MAYQNNIESIFSLNTFIKTEKLARFAEVKRIGWYLLPAGNLLYKGRIKIMGNNENVETQIVIREMHSSGISWYHKTFSVCFY